MKLFIYHENQMKEFSLVSTSQVEIEKSNFQNPLLEPKEVKVNESKQKELFTIEDLILIFDNTRPTIYAWIKKKLLFPIRISGRVYFDPVDVKELIDKKRVVK